jgi:YbgC/YbaW family acyl-CoA thioester hydrolase
MYAHSRAIAAAGQAERGAAKGVDGPRLAEEHYRFRLPIKVYGDDMNSRGYADASSYLRYMDRGRVEAIEAICAEAGERSWLDSYVVNVYRIDAKCATIVRLGDRLEVQTGLRKTSSHRAAFDQRIVNLANGAPVLEAVVEVLFLDEQRRLVAVPESVVSCEHTTNELTAGRPSPAPFTDEDRFPFRARHRVYYEDTDAQGITYHVSYVRFCERALWDLVQTIWPDMTEQAWSARNKVGLSGFDIRYLNSSSLGDWLEVRTGVLGLTSHQLTFGQRIVSAASGRVIADVITDCEFRDERDRVVAVPRQVVDLGTAHLPDPEARERQGSR